ncbi:SDR family NAD(P)-dependent oxidoreductase [Cognatishimia sp. F0-27]|uniref:SDR family NAD(P)-dependent oxidoreductase n=1 Tax=Cognatishimia sp. F0-27 TaxID=2816855 RepID=UPI001D0C4899|nr:SDR family oxidoreductase [Cognatishimia sp. F0-27]MCC1495031.1 SDR family oxidoreductase [Cognatishimia sp. F0-27]
MARRVLITGGSRGIGLSFAHACLGAGMDVAITAARGRHALEASVADLRAAYPERRVVGILADAGDPADAARTAAEAQAALGGVDVLINNAGRGPRELNDNFHNAAQRFWELDPQGWAEIMRTNVDGPFLMARAVAPLMIAAGWGRIVNLSTSRVTMIKEGFAPYGPSKAALDTMTRLFADDLRGTGVTVNTLAPGGATETDFIPPENRSGAYASLLPVTVMDAALLWLLSDAADAVTAGRFIGKLWDPANPAAAREDTGEAPRIL